MKTLLSLLLLMVGFGMVIAQDEAATESAASLYNDGLAKLKAKEYLEAYDLLMKSIEVADPTEDAQVLKLAKGNGAICAYYAGTTLIKEEKYDEAMEKFEKGLELNPKSYTCAYGKAKVYDDQDKTTMAVESYMNAATVATEAGKADRAERYSSRAGNLVGLAYGDEKYDEAIEAGEKFLESTDDKDVRYYMAKCLIAKGQPSDALAHAEKALEMGGLEEEGKYQMIVAESYEAAGNNDAAAMAYSKVPAGKYAEVAKYKANDLKK